MPSPILLALLFTADAPCAAIDTALPPALIGWRDAAPGTLEPGRAVKVALVPADEVGFAIAPERPGSSGSFGGAFALHIDRPGTYRVALSRSGWISVANSGRLVPSIAHGHGPACSSIRKIVDFDLSAGDHVVQLSGLEANEAVVMVTAK